jgi:hypothetical protein
MVLQQARHYMRYMRADQGEKPEQIAASEGVSLQAVEKSIKMVRFHRGLNTQSNLNTAVVGMLMGNLNHVDKTFQRMFKAKNYIEHKKPDGSTKLVPIEDTETQMKALEVYGKFVGSLQPKSAGVNLSVQQNNANQSASISNARGGGYEEMLHGILGNVRSHNDLPPQTADVIDAEEDGEEEEDDATVQA